MKLGWLAGVALALVLADGGATAQVAADATIVFHFERPGLPVPEYTLTVHPDGSGSFVGMVKLADSRARGAAVDVPPEKIERPLTLTTASAGKLFARAQEVNRFHVMCGTRLKNVADTGAKTLSYTGADGEGHCTYNYSDNKVIAELTTAFQGMALTLEEGYKLEMAHRFDRLGLDAEIKSLADAVNDGRAAGLANIRKILQSLVDDPQVLERVRTRAAELMARGEAGV